MPLVVEHEGPVTVVTIDRPAQRNAVDRDTAEGLNETFTNFDKDESASVAVLTGAGGTFCAGADLKGIAAGEGRPVRDDGDGPMGPTRLALSKPVIAAVEGYAVAGGLELAIWCDMRVAAADAVFGVFCRRFGVPLVDLGTIRLPRLVGHGNAMDMILTGRGVSCDEALRIGLVNRLVPPGTARRAAVELALELAALPQMAMRADRLSLIEQWGLAGDEAMRSEVRHGLTAIGAGESAAGAALFASGIGRHGSAADSR